MGKLGTNKRPAIVRVQSQEHAAEIVSLAEERGWIVIAGVETDQPEDISDMLKLLRKEETKVEKPRLPPRSAATITALAAAAKSTRIAAGRRRRPRALEIEPPLAFQQRECVTLVQK